MLASTSKEQKEAKKTDIETTKSDSKLSKSDLQSCIKNLEENKEPKSQTAQTLPPKKTEYSKLEDKLPKEDLRKGYSKDDEDKKGKTTPRSDEGEEMIEVSKKTQKSTAAKKRSFRRKNETWRTWIPTSGHLCTKINKQCCNHLHSSK